MKHAAIIALMNSEKKILCQLRDNKPWIVCPNCWGFIGGSVEGNEIELEAVKREIKEEIGLDITPIKKIGEFIHKEISTKVSVFLGKIEKKAEDIDLKEGQEVRYFSLKELDHINMPGPLKEFILEHQKDIFEDIS